VYEYVPGIVPGTTQECMILLPSMLRRSLPSDHGDSADIQVVANSVVKMFNAVDGRNLSHTMFDTCVDDIPSRAKDVN
jgi:hypothetical protein